MNIWTVVAIIVIISLLLTIFVPMFINIGGVNADYFREYHGGGGGHGSGSSHSGGGSRGGYGKGMSWGRGRRGNWDGQRDFDYGPGYWPYNYGVLDDWYYPYPVYGSNSTETMDEASCKAMCDKQTDCKQYLYNSGMGSKSCLLKK